MRHLAIMALVLVALVGQLPLLSTNQALAVVVAPADDGLGGLGTPLSITPTLGEARPRKMDAVLEEYISTGQLPSDEEVRCFKGKLSVIVVAKGDLDAISELMHVSCTARLGNTYLVFGLAPSPEAVRVISDLPGTVYIMADRHLRLKEPDFKQYCSHQDASNVLDQWKVREIIGVDKVEGDLNIWGDGVVISIVDTGVDFGVPDLSYAVDRDGDGYITSFDPSGTGLALTNYTFEKNEHGMLPISGQDFLVWFWGSFTAYSQLKQMISGLPDLQDIYVGDTIQSKSGLYHVGIMLEYGPALSIDAKLGCFICVVVDSTTPGVYDTLYVDLDWDFSIADEEPHRWGDPEYGSEILAKDINGDGWPDVSAGCLCRVFDYFGVAGGGIIEGIHPSGNWVAFMYDYYGHGTPCAASAAGRGIMAYDIYKNGTLYTLPGMARKARIQAIKMLTTSDIVMGWMWSCGFDLDEHGTWVYTGQHKADIISNSWGYSEFEQLGGFATGWDMLSLMIDRLSTPGILDPDYPGTLFLVAGGNGGSGYGTATAPAVATSAICVGATTSYHPFEPAYGPGQGYDEVVYWSARGPSPTGAPEPDVLNVGWMAFSPYPLWVGRWNGRDAWGIFGGTSMATPLTAGVCALVIEALRSRHVEVDPGLVKCIIQSTAEDLGYDPLTQGAGRVSAFRAVSAALGLDEADGRHLFFACSTATSYNVGQIVRDAFYFWSGAEHPAITSPLRDASLFLGRVGPGGSLGCAIYAKTPSGLPIDSLYAVRLTLVGRAEVVLPRTEGVYNTYVLTEVLGEEFMDQFFSCDLAMIFLSYDVEQFRRLALSAQNPPYVFLHDWRDLNLNGQIDYNGTGEVKRISDCFRWSNALAMFVGWPSRDFHRYNPSGVEKGPTIMFHDTGFESFSDWEGIELRLTVLLFSEEGWSWVSTTRDAADATLWHVSVSVPEDARPGVHAGFLIMERGGAKKRLPMSFVVVGRPPRGPSSLRFENTTSCPYDLGAIYGAYDWSWREESGDYRIFAFEIADASAKYAVFAALWSLRATMLDAWVVGPDGRVLGKSHIVHVSEGRFESKSTRDRGQVLVVELEGPGVYTFVLHATAFNGTFNPENITIYAYYARAELPEAVPSWSVENGSVIYGPHAMVSVSWNITPVEEFPDIMAYETQLSIMKGIYLRFEGSIDPAEDTLEAGWYENVGRCEDYIYVWLRKGMKVYIEVGWIGPLTDIDVFCWPPGVEQTFDNSLLGEATATLNNPEKGTFVAPVTGNYTIGIDWYGGPASELPVPYYVIVSTLRGFTISGLGGEATIDTSIMGSNGTFLLNTTLLTGTNVEYKSNITVTAYNFFPPSVEIIYPRPGDVVNGTVLIQWRAEDPNVPDETLTFDLYVSFDGGTTWLPLAYQLQRTSYEWDTRPSSWRGIEFCNETMIRVVVSDGKVEREDVSGPFTVDNRPPAPPTKEKPVPQPVVLRPEAVIGIGAAIGAGVAVGVAYVMLKRKREAELTVPTAWAS